MKSVIFKSKDSLSQYDFDSVEIDEYWNKSMAKEARMHSIHNYPAKFPAFIADKAIEYALPLCNNKISCITVPHDYL